MESLYPDLFAQRFREDMEEGYAFLEALMSNREPSVGYVVLARIMAETAHKIVVTTNFDNLVADTLATYMGVQPLMCGHESLAGFVRLPPRRPVIIKLHRDVMLHPMSDPSEVAALHPDLVRQVKEIFSRYTPIVIGYGGNDGGLMRVLRDIGEGEVPGGLFWCHLLGFETPSDDVSQMLATKGWHTVAIDGFDELMFGLANVLGMPLLDAELEQSWASKIHRYRRQVESLISGSGVTHIGSMVSSVRNTIDHSPQNWWSWHLRTLLTDEPFVKRALYNQALTIYPSSPELAARYGNLLFNELGEWNEAEVMYRTAVQYGPGDARNWVNLARLLAEAGQLKESEACYLHAVDVGGGDVLVAANYATFLLVTGRGTEAKWVVARAWEKWDDSAGAWALAGASWVALAMVRGLAEATEGADDADALGRLKWMLARGVTNREWSFAWLLSRTGEHALEAHGAYHEIADAVTRDGSDASLRGSAWWELVREVNCAMRWPV